MFNIVCTTGPISGKDLDDLTGRPFVADFGNETGLTVYFESERNKLACLEIPLGHPTSDIPVNLDNPTDERIDEG
jgi:hypothetical protein